MLINSTQPHRKMLPAEKIALLPAPFRKAVLSEYHSTLATKGQLTANLYYLGIGKLVKTVETNRSRFAHLSLNEHGLKMLAKSKSARCVEMWKSTKSDDPSIAYKRIISYIESKGIELKSLIRDPSSEEMLYLIRRSIDDQWWLRQLRTQQSRDIESIARTLNFISRPKQIYASDLSVKRRRKQRQRHAEFLDVMIATNEIDEEFTLKELQDTSVSNPVIRKQELMVRCRGFDNYAKDLGHESLFITMTCPSKFHRAYSKSGDPVPNWNGATPLDAQNYLCETWAKIRASLDREGIYPYGFRVAEPNHDGTPHWHLLLFISPDKSSKLVEIMERYCLEEDSDEKGAEEHRLKIVKMDEKKGDATGYIAKYISKNIDGSDLEEGIYGENPIEAAQRVDTWSSVWGIRQFQQIGGAPVSVWREIRRLREAIEAGSELEEARKAADDADWSKYQDVMGGTTCPRKKRPIRLTYWNKINLSTGEIIQNQYGELKAPSIFGVEYEGIYHNTRPHEWKISKALGY